MKTIITHEKKNIEYAHRFSRTWADGVIARRGLILVFTFLLMSLSWLPFKNLYYDASNEAYFLKGDPALVSFNNLVDLFGDVDYLVVGVPARATDKDVFNAETIQVIDQLSQFLQENRHITQVRSLSEYQYTHSDGGILATDDLFDEIELLSETPDRLEQARSIISHEKLALDNLITRDYRNTRILARVEYHKGENRHNVELISELLDFIDRQQYREQGFDLKISGMPAFNEHFETLTIRDQSWINPLMGLIMLLFLLYLFRSFFAMVTPLVVIFATMLFVTSVQGVFYFAFTAVTSALMPTMLILSMGTSVHVLVDFFQARREGLSPSQAARTTTRDLLFPIFFTSTTTAIGFITLSITRLGVVQEYAWLASFGAMVIFLFSTTALPALLSFVHFLPRTPHWRHGNADNTRLQRFVRALPDLIFRHRHTLGIAGIVITMFSLASVSLLRVDTNAIKNFKQDSRLVQDLLYLDRHFNGSNNLEFIIDSGSDGGVKDPLMLQRALALQGWVESFAETGKPTSILDVYRQINKALNEDREQYFRLPDTQSAAAQFLLLYENSGPNENLSDMKDFSERYLRISVPVVNMSASAMEILLTKMKSGLAEHFGDLTVTITGRTVLLQQQNIYVDKGIFQSFSIAIAVISLCFFFLFRSLKYGLIAMVPSIVPILLTGGLISLAGISLDLGTMIVGTMTIGIAVDDSIHLMSRYLLLRRRGKDTHSAIAAAIASSGRAVILTSIILVAGFSVMLGGSFIPYIYVGLFSAMIMSFALVGDLIFMPAILYLIDGERIEKFNKHTVTLQKQEIITNAK